MGKDFGIGFSFFDRLFGTSSKEEAILIKQETCGAGQVQILERR